MNALKMIFLTLTSFLAIFSFVPIVHAQESFKANAEFGANAINQISSKFAEMKARDQAVVNSIVQNEAVASSQVSEITTARIAAQSGLNDADTRVQRISAISPELGGHKTAEYRSAVQWKRLAADAVETSQKAEKAAIQSLARARADKRDAEQLLAINLSRRDEQLQTLSRLKDVWQANPTVENEIAFTDEVTSVSCEYNVFANPFWRSKPMVGATILYQTVGERRRGADVHRISNPSDSQQKICQGRYFVWTERNGKESSDRNATPYDITVDTKEVTVTERQQ